MVKSVYPTNFLLELQGRLTKEVGFVSSSELSVLTAIRCITSNDETLLAIGASYKEIKLTLVVSHENLSKSLKTLERHGLVNRNKDGNDGRVIRYQLTPKAWEILAATDNFVARELMRFMVDRGEAYLVSHAPLN